VQSSKHFHSRWIAEQLAILAEAVGEALTPSRLKIYAEALSDLDQQQLSAAFGRALRECKFFPRIAELRELAGAGHQESEDAECRLMWDKLSRFVDRYIQSDVWGGYGIREGCTVEVPQRVLDTVRRTGGWQVYKCMTPQDFPFIQKRFLEEYKAWHAVERVALERRLPSGVEPPLKALVAGKSMEPAPPTEAKDASSVEAEIARLTKELKAKTAAAAQKCMPPLPHDWYQRDEAEAQRKAALLERAKQTVVVPVVDPEIEKKLIADSVARHRAQCTDPTCRCRTAASEGQEAAGGRA